MITENTLIQGKNFLKESGIMNQPGFMVSMIKKCRPVRLLDFEIFDGADSSQVLFNTDSYIKLSEYLSKKGMDKEIFRQILEGVNLAVKECSEYLLDPERLVLDAGSIYTRPSKFELMFCYSFFETKKLRQSMKNFFTSILGNYYSDFGIMDERFREWAAREINKSDFSTAKMLAAWEYNSKAHAPVSREISEVKNEDSRGISFFKNLLEKTFEAREKGNNETLPIGGRGEGMYLTGICSIDTRIPVAEEGITIGRQMLKQDYGLYNSGIGKAHARIYIMDDEVYIADMGSRNGTYLNGERMEKQKPKKILRGDIVSFSDEEFILC